MSTNGVNNVCCKLILASDPVTDVKRKFNIPKYEILSSLFNKFQQFPNDIPLCTLGRIVLMCHHWQNVTLINSVKATILGRGY